MNNPKNKIIKFYANQKLWLALAVIMIGLFVYGEVTATRLFTSTAVEDWKPSGQNSHNSSIHHK